MLVGRSVTLVRSSDQMIAKFVSRTTCHSAELNIFLERVAPISFCDVGRDGSCCPAQLWCEGIFFLSGKFLNNRINQLSKFSGELPDLKVGEISYTRN